MCEVSSIYPGFLGAIGDVNDKVNDLNEATEGIDGDEEEFSSLDVGIEYPKHCTEQSCHIWNRLKPLR